MTIPLSPPRSHRGERCAVLAVCLLACAHPPRAPGAAMPPRQADPAAHPAAHPAAYPAPAPATAPAPLTLRQRYGLRPPSAIDPAHTALVLVDVQREFLDGGLPLPDAARAIDHARALLAWARYTGLQVVIVRQQAAAASAPLFAPGSPGAELASGLAPLPGEIAIVKSAAGAFSNTALHRRLAERGVTLLIIAGLMTHLAVDTTARDGTVLGYRVVIAGDATATRALPGPHGDGVIDHALLQRTALAALADRFADIATTAEILALPIAGAAEVSAIQQP